MGFPKVEIISIFRFIQFVLFCFLSQHSYQQCIREKLVSYASTLVVLQKLLSINFLCWCWLSFFTDNVSRNLLRLGVGFWLFLLLITDILLPLSKLNQRLPLNQPWLLSHISRMPLINPSFLQVVKLPGKCFYSFGMHTGFIFKEIGLL